MDSQIVLALLSDAGGVGKTTIAVNIAYEWAMRGRSVAILDLDSNHSLESFVGLKAESNIKKTSYQIFESEFEGNWQLKSVLASEKIDILPGHSSLTADTIANRKRREYILSKTLQKFPLPHSLVILDCRAGLDLITDNALAASNQILIPLDLGVKAKTVANSIKKILTESENLELDPPPSIMGLLPNHYNKGAAYEEQLLKALKNISSKLNIKLYPPIRRWGYLKNASTLGQALKQNRAGDPLCQIFGEIVNDLEGVLNNG